MGNTHPSYNNYGLAHTGSQAPLERDAHGHPSFFHLRHTDGLTVSIRRTPSVRHRQSVSQLAQVGQASEGRTTPEEAHREEDSEPDYRTQLSAAQHQQQETGGPLQQLRRPWWLL